MAFDTVVVNANITAITREEQGSKQFKTKKSLLFQRKH